MSSPTAKTLEYLRRSGFTADVCERWLRLPIGDRRKDFLGVGDIIACRPTTGEVLMVQCTSLANLSSRVAKAKRCPGLRAWVQCARFECWGWHRTAAGKWDVKRVELNGADLESTVLTPTRRRGRRPQQADLFAEATT